MPAPLSTFVQTSDALAATTKKLIKQQLLADYLRPLDDADLLLAIRYSAGRAFAATDERVLGVSGAIVFDAVLPLLPIAPNDFGPLIVKHGEMGEAIAAAWPESPTERASTTDPLTLADIAVFFEDLASIGNIENKTQLVRELFTRCHGPREAAYIAKIILSDLRTGAREGVLQAAVAIAFDKTLIDIQRTQLLVGDLGDVALLAKANQLESATFKLFHPIQFMLAVPRETAADILETMESRPYIAEHKLDGIRAQIHKSSNTQSGDRIAIYTRTMDRTDESFPDIVAAIAKIPGDFLLDGEIVPYRDGVVLPFANIQKRLGRKVLNAKILRDHPAAFIAFDLLYLNGDLLMNKPLRDRRERLISLSDNLLTPQQIEVTTLEQIDAAFCTARDCRNEGLVLKDPDSLYSPGRRGTAWLKLKTHLPTLDCVVTAAEHGHGKRRAVLSDYTFAVWDRDPAIDGAELVNVGKAYSGVTDEEISQLTDHFKSTATSTNGRVYRVAPTTVFEIAFDQIQKSVRHASGFALRFPRIKRIRWDKRPPDADTIQRVRDIYESATNMARTDAVTAPAEPSLFDHLPQ